MIFKDTRLLVIASHPDDEVLGCGGTLLKALDQGAEIRIVFLGEGISARFPIGQYDSDDFREQSRKRRREAENALKVMEIQDVHYGERLCTQFDTYPFLSIVKEIEGFMHLFKPDIVFTHNPSEVNIDHKVTYEAVEVACRPVNDYTPKEVYTFEIVCSGNWKFQPYFQPNVFVDISKYWEKKLKAWSCYENERRPFPFPRSDEGLEALSRFRGMASGMEKAEAFYLARKIIK